MAFLLELGLARSLF